MTMTEKFAGCHKRLELPEAEVIEFCERRSEKKSELFRAVFAGRISEQRGGRALHDRTHLIYGLCRCVR